MSRPSLREQLIQELKALLEAREERRNVLDRPAPTPPHQPLGEPLYGVCDLCLQKRDGVLVFGLFSCPSHNRPSKACRGCWETIPPDQRRETYCAYCAGVRDLTVKKPIEPPPAKAPEPVKGWLSGWFY